ncbi:MAG: hypothetical protein J4N89_11630, partial [Chloroflexi bacterium]|nr:hypothetical protein [Chloroflexota bacterium]
AAWSSVNKPSVSLVPFQLENDQCHSDPSAEGEESGDGWNGPTPDTSPLRLAQHDIFRAMASVIFVLDEHKMSNPMCLTSPRCQVV